MNRNIAPPVHSIGPLTMPDENVTVLDNGVTLHTFDGGYQPVSHLCIAFAGGVAEVGGESQSRLAVSQMVEGTASHSDAEIADILDFNGARIGFRTQGHHSVLDLWMLNDKASRLLPTIGDCIANATYPDTPFESARRRTISAYMTSHSEPNTLADEAFTSLMYGADTPLGRNETLDDIEHIDTHRLRAIHPMLTCPARMHAFLAGKLDHRLISSVAETLGSLPKTKQGYTPDIVPMRPEEPSTRRIQHPDSCQDAIIAGMPAPPRNHPDYIPLRLAVMALGGYFGSRLMTNIREDKGLTYGIQASLLGSLEGSYIAISAKCDPSFTNRVFDEIDAEILALQTNPPRGEELERLRLHAATSLAEILDTPDAVMSYYANRLFVGTPDDYFELQSRHIENLTPETIAAMARKYIDPEQLTRVSAGK